MIQKPSIYDSINNNAAAATAPAPCSKPDFPVRAQTLYIPQNGCAIHINAIIENNQNWHNDFMFDCQLLQQNYIHNSQAFDISSGDTKRSPRSCELVLEKYRVCIGFQRNMNGNNIHDANPICERFEHLKIHRKKTVFHKEISIGIA